MAILVVAKVTYLTPTLAVPMVVLDEPWWAVILGFVLMHCAVSLVFACPLVCTHFAEEAAFPAADEGGYVEGCWATHQLATSLDYCPESRLANSCWVGSTPTPPTTCSRTSATSTTSRSRRIIKATAHEHGVRYMRCRTRRPSAPTSGS